MARRVTTSGRIAADAATVFVDVSTRTVSADVVREGYRVPAANLDKKKADFFLGELVGINKRDEPRVVGQSVAKGTSVPTGTAVDLILTPRKDVPLGIFDRVHVALEQHTVEDLLSGNGPLVDPGIREEVLQYENAVDVPKDVREHLITVFQERGIAIDESKSNTSFESAFNGARAALAFR